MSKPLPDPVLDPPQYLDLLAQMASAAQNQIGSVLSTKAMMSKSAWDASIFPQLQDSGRQAQLQRIALATNAINLYIDMGLLDPSDYANEGRFSPVTQAWCVAWENNRDEAWYLFRDHLAQSWFAAVLRAVDPGDERAAYEALVAAAEFDHDPTEQDFAALEAAVTLLDYFQLLPSRPGAETEEDRGADTTIVHREADDQDNESEISTLVHGTVETLDDGSEDPTLVRGTVEDLDDEREDDQFAHGPIPDVDQRDYFPPAPAVEEFPPAEDRYSPERQDHVPDSAPLDSFQDDHASDSLRAYEDDQQEEPQEADNAAPSGDVGVAYDDLWDQPETLPPPRPASPGRVSSRAERLRNRSGSLDEIESAPPPALNTASSEEPAAPPPVGPLWDEEDRPRPEKRPAGPPYRISRPAPAEPEDESPADQIPRRSRRLTDRTSAPRKTTELPRRPTVDSQGSTQPEKHDTASHRRLVSQPKDSDRSPARPSTRRVTQPDDFHRKGPRAGGQRTAKPAGSPPPAQPPADVDRPSITISTTSSGEVKINLDAEQIARMSAEERANLERTLRKIKRAFFDPDEPPPDDPLELGDELD